jgi:hypothetical protein
LHQEDQILFSLLKKEIVAAMKLTYPGINPEISEWKGQEITDFQEDLLFKVNGRLSEKWFYTHMKAFNTSLPRIDVLNMLCKYAGYSNWDDFRFKNSVKIPLTETLKNKDKSPVKTILILLAAVILLIILSMIKITQNHLFTFVDADTGEPIKDNKVQVDLLLKDESPVSYLSNNDGSFVLRTDQSIIKMVVRAPYYLTDTIIRVLNKFDRTEQVRLYVDIYALMIQYFSQTDLGAWQKKREQLDRILSENAFIYQLPDQGGRMGMELYNKWEFIDKLTIPASNLRRIEILDSRYDKGQIAVLRFRIKNE